MDCKLVMRNIFLLRIVVQFNLAWQLLLVDFAGVLFYCNVKAPTAATSISRLRIVSLVLLIGEEHFRPENKRNTDKEISLLRQISL